mgnify:CR=1 FL=1
MANHISGMTFWDHFEELRRRIIRSILYIIIGTCIGLLVSRQVLAILVEPLSKAVFHKTEEPLIIQVDEEGRLYFPGEFSPGDLQKKSRFRIAFHFDKTDRTINFGPDYRTNFYYFSPVDPFILWLKAAFLVGLVLAIPVIVFEIWKFVSPALSNHEKKLVIPVVIAGFILFPIGVIFAWHLMRFALGFFTRYTFQGLEPRLSVLKYINFALTLMLAAGTVFELPVVVVILSWGGLISSSFLRKYRRHAIIVMFVISALITPPDIFTMFAIALPLLILYEISILLAALIEKKKEGRITE